jgi:hypothetical protein
MKTLVVLALAACGSHDDRGAGVGSGSSHVVVIADASTGSAEPQVALGSDGLPATCGQWRAALDKLDTCTALPENARTSLKAIYADVSKNWGQLPSDAKAKLGPICQSGADSVLKGAKATCGW